MPKPFSNGFAVYGKAYLSQLRQFSIPQGRISVSLLDTLAVEQRY
jgi:hypothetical protein